MKCVNVLLILFLWSGSAFAQARTGSAAQEKAPWEWTSEERIAARTDMVKATERVKAAAAAMVQLRREPGPHVVDVIDGRRNPELFLPVELFRLLVTLGYIGEPWRDDWDTRLAAAGLPGNFWKRLEAIDSDYINDLLQEDVLLQSAKSADAEGRDRINQELTGRFPRMCRDRADALARARKEFGVALDRFLYTVVAPSTSTAFEEPQDPDQLRATEGGCR